MENSNRVNQEMPTETAARRRSAQRMRQTQNRTIRRSRRQNQRSRAVTHDSTTTATAPTNIATTSSAGLETIMEVPHTAENVCAICMAPFAGQDIGTPNCCSHNFCLTCLKRWSRVRKSCPLDRQAFLWINVRREIGGRVIRKIPKRVRRQQQSRMSNATLTRNDLFLLGLTMESLFGLRSAFRDWDDE